MESLLAEQKSRQELEGMKTVIVYLNTFQFAFHIFISSCTSFCFNLEQYQKVMHDQMNLNNEKTHLENQFKNLQQRLEITTELYQQKENALQQ